MNDFIDILDKLKTLITKNNAFSNESIKQGTDLIYNFIKPYLPDDINWNEINDDPIKGIVVLNIIIQRMAKKIIESFNNIKKIFTRTLDGGLALEAAIGAAISVSGLGILAVTIYSIFVTFVWGLITIVALFLAVLPPLVAIGTTGFVSIKLIDALYAMFVIYQKSSTKRIMLSNPNLVEKLDEATLEALAKSNVSGDMNTFMETSSNQAYENIGNILDKAIDSATNVVNKSIDILAYITSAALSATSELSAFIPLTGGGLFDNISDIINIKEYTKAMKTFLNGFFIENNKQYLEDAINLLKIKQYRELVMKELNSPILEPIHKFITLIPVFVTILKTNENKNLEPKEIIELFSKFFESPNKDHN
jgi:hypothetical protein